MAGLWGLKEIAEALEVSEKTAVRWYWDLHLPMLRRRKGGHPRIYWWASREMLTSWLLAKSKMDRELLAEQRKARRGAEAARELGSREGNGEGR